MKKKLDAAKEFLTSSTRITNGGNHFVGVNAGFNTSTGNRNTAIGGQALGNLRTPLKFKNSSENIKDVLKYSRISKEFEAIIETTKDSFKSIIDGKRK